ncbi:MAG: lysophospholipid acyltransferase family protein [Lachnospiraceae bacterium]
MIRLILVLLYVFLFFVLSILIFPIEWVIGKFSPHAKGISSLRMVQFIFKSILFFSSTKITVIGEENVPKDVPVLYVGNHRSYFDIIITYARCPRETGYMAKKEMKKVPFLNWWMMNLHCLFLDRKDIKQGLKTILEAIDLIKSGVSVCIFPEGTRNESADPLEVSTFHEGSFKVASKTGCPIIPMALTGTSKIFEDQFPKIHPHEIILEYGRPIYPKELSKEDQKRLGGYAREQIIQMLKNH